VEAGNAHTKRLLSGRWLYIEKALIPVKARARPMKLL